MTEPDFTDDQHVLTTKAPVWMLATVAGVFGLFYAYAVWSAVAALTTISSKNDLTGTGWALLILPIVVAIAVYVVAVAVGFRRRIGEFSLILLTGLALVQVYWMNTVALLGTSGTTYIA